MMGRWAGAEVGVKLSPASVIHAIIVAGTFEAM